MSNENTNDFICRKCGMVPNTSCIDTHCPRRGTSVTSTDSSIVFPTTHPQGENKEFIVKDDMICPRTGLHCDDECCTVGSECNISDEISNPTPQGEPKTDEEILKPFIGEYQDMNLDSPTYLRIVFLAKQILSEARASERAQSNQIFLSQLEINESLQKELDALKSIEIPQCLQECRLSFDRKFELSTNQQYSSSKTFVADLVEAEMLEKFSLLLSQVKGLPTNEDAEIKLSTQLLMATPEYRAVAESWWFMATDWYREQAALLLLQRDEAHKAEAETLFENVIKWYDKFIRYDDPDEYPMWELKKMFDLFLKEKEGRNG